MPLNDFSSICSGYFFFLCTSDLLGSLRKRLRPKDIRLNPDIFLYYSVFIFISSLVIRIIVPFDLRLGGYC